MTPNTLEELFKSQLGESFEMNGSTTWEQIAAKRESESKPATKWVTSRKTKIIAISIIAAGVCAAALHRYVQPNTPITTTTPKTIQPANHHNTNSATVTLLSDSTTTTSQKVIEKTQKPSIPQHNTAQDNNPELNAQASDTAQTINPLLPATLSIDTTKRGMKVDTIFDKPKPVKTVVIVQKQQIIVKDTTVTTVKKRLRRRL